MEVEMLLNKQEAKEWAVILEAFSEGKQIEVYNIDTNTWEPLTGDLISLTYANHGSRLPEEYRII